MKFGDEIFIEGNTPSLKNSKIVTSRGVFHSKTVAKYLRSLGIQHFSSSKKIVKEYKTRDNLFRKAFEDAGWVKPEGQIKLGFHFVRNSRRKFDYINAVQLPLDLMTAMDLIEDDNADYIVPVFYKRNGAYYSYSKENAGVFIKLMRL